MSLIVFECILDHRYQNDRAERQRHHGLSTSDRNTLDSLHVGNQQKVEVGGLAELGVQVERDERDHAVLGSSNRVVAEIVLHIA